ncbi:MAG TPA: tol-pal system protein YbgF [Blastocatellia bacterium]|nr:tol-pal system protein YbgF [Blastocatellia bacterium]
MKYRFAIIMVVALLLPISVGASGGGNDKDKEQLAMSLDQLKNEITVLERQVSTLQQGIDRNSGQTSTLMTQLIDTVNSIKLAQSRVTESANAALTQVGGIGDQISAANQRMDQLSSQIAELKRLVQNLPKEPAFSQINPGDPDQVFAAGIADYHRGNYDLALSEFQGFLEKFPDTLMACSAQYWTGMTMLGKGKPDEAIQEFEKVKTAYPKCDRVPMALYQEGLALQQAGRADEAAEKLNQVVKYYRGTSAAELAKQALNKPQ